MAVANNTFNNLKTRWETPIGIAYLDTIKQFINTSTTTTNALIDFSTIVAPAEFNEYNLGQRDLAFIKLDDIEIENCTLLNASLSKASFRKSKFSNVKFDNCLLDETDFSRSEFYKVVFNNTTTISGSNFKSAQIIQCSLNDYNIKKAINFSKPSYFLIVTKAFLKFICIEVPIRKHTLFVDIDVSNLNSWTNKEVKEHIIWYEHLMYRIEKIHSGGFMDSPKLLFSILTTFYWSSYTVLACWAITFNVYMAYKITNLPEDAFTGVSGDFCSALYYSIVTFTTLGYGDIHPNKGIGMIYAGTIAVVGYVTLGILIYLISRKVDKKF